MALREKGPYDEEEDWQVLLKKAEKFELKELQRIIVKREQLLVLGKLLNDAYVIRRPKPSEYEHRKDLIRVFNEIAKEIYGNSTGFPVVEAFGSFSMDLFTTGSDLDLSINFRSSSLVFPRDQKIKTLRKFARKFYALQNGGHVRGVQPIMSAKVPILKVVDAGTGVECDLSVENRDGISKSAIIRFITSIDERFQKLSFLMKAWAKAHNINSSKDRTLNSLSIILLVAFHLQTREPPILPPFSAILKDGEDLASVKKSVRNFQNYGVRNTESLGELFVSFLIQLASVEKLWPKGLCASPYQAHWTSKTWDTKIASMSVEDFTDRTQNVARAVGKSEVEEIYKCIHLTIRNLASFMSGEIQESELKRALFGIDKTLHHPVHAKPNVQPVTILKRRENLGTNRHVMAPNRVLEPRATQGWATRPPSLGYWDGTQRRSMTTGPDTSWVEQPFDHQSTKRMRAAEGVQRTQGWGSAYGGPGWSQGWGGASTVGWGGTHGAASMHNPRKRSQEMQPAKDPWGRTLLHPPAGNSSMHGPPFR
ncbi:uncharacterized protein LOC112517923 isoform X1 [Cynara cardunculus var. scolymus]|uniref:uncharacterized protein LOC112517923 isoform X1 n=2 Tax=Cynara cardunculus var. scolymus TaxID=59895 RepID=UPI000D62F892|nr:uncharacterized protein LOC112517923 isoform X1 [Cynara cardunculus var. scolymus]XP_024981112.1 uncharacterized protein LOC112517923 isoform X1 [Cynara cardunculus var. scolymus]XP_024981114.1 uncharacterized protein LOC112517923 isoform X1 [Cynara cardunculus var. scolymus]